MAVLNKNWGSTDRVAPSTAVITGRSAPSEEEKAEKDAEQEFQAPKFVYITDGPVGGFDKVEEVVLMKDEVCIGMWAFDTVKISSEHAKADPLLKEAGEEVPRFVFISHDMDDVEVIEDKQMKAKNVLKVMEKMAKDAYGVSLKSRCKKMLKVLGDYDKLAGARKVLQDKEARAEGKESKLKKLAKEREALDKEEAELQKKHAELLKFEPKK